MIIEVEKQDVISVGDLLVEIDTTGLEYYYLVAANRIGSDVYLIMLNTKRGQKVPMVYETYPNIEELNRKCGLDKVSEYSRLSLNG